MSEIIEEAKAVAAKLQHKVDVREPLFSEDCVKMADTVRRLAAELAKAREACEQGKWRAQNYLEGLRRGPFSSRSPETLIFDGMIQSLQFDFMQALGEEISPAAALAAKGSK